MEVLWRHLVADSTDSVLQRQVGVAHLLPDCLQEDANGPLIDSADHRSHMVDAGSAGCPSNYIPVPRLQTNFQFPMPTTRGKVKLSSDHPGAPPGSTMHADFFNAWQEGTLEDLVERCINGGPFTASNPKDADCA